ncbi:MAG: CBS domain-containing protein [Acidimicrobiia bacterium]|nr:CBS domain-containing protein [Acidimicrobiia bacterium]
MQVADLLKKKGREVATIEPTATIGSVCDLLRERGIGALVVSADGTTIDGIISERDIVRALGAGASDDLLERPCHDIMTAEVFTCSNGDRVQHLMSMMTEKRIRHLPVEDGGGLAGIISIGDVVKHRLSELEEETRLLEDYIQHGR